MEKDSKRFAKSADGGTRCFNYDAASDKFTPDAKSLSDCGFACHTPVKAKDYIFHPCRSAERACDPYRSRPGVHNCTVFARRSV